MKRQATRSCFLALVLSALAACGQGAEQGNGSGTLDDALVISPGVTVSTATYTISGPDDFASAGSVPLGDSPDLSIPLSGLPLGTGYEIDVSATASDNVTLCHGSNTFDVVGSSTTVLVHLVCGVPSGDINVTASINVCPQVDGLDALPSQALIGGKAYLTATAHDSDNGPSALSYRWAVNGAPLANHPQPTLTFTCTAAGALTIAVTVSDGDPNPMCKDTLSTTITCAAP